MKCLSKTITFTMHSTYILTCYMLIISNIFQFVWIKLMFPLISNLTCVLRFTDKNILIYKNILNAYC